MENLALQVRKVHRVVVDHSEAADAGGREVKGRRGSEATGSDTEDRPLAQGLLTLTSKGRKGKVTLIALFFAF